jgi:hypothetical protein
MLVHICCTPEVSKPSTVLIVLLKRERQKEREGVELSAASAIMSYR